MAIPVEERRLLTVLFGEVNGFDDLVSTTEFEDLQEIDSAVLRFLEAQVEKEGGTVHKYDSGRVIALFGFPLAHEDDPERSVRTALGMQQGLPRADQLAPRLPKGTTFSGLQIGIHSGIVFVGEVGTHEKSEQTVMGDVVNYASRLKDLARPGETVVSESIFRRSRYLVEYDACPPVAVKGFDQPQRIFRPMRLRPRPQPKRSTSGLSSPLVGRDAELDRLRAAVRRLEAGEGGAIFVLGEAGIGKSRLREEIRDYVLPSKEPGADQPAVRYLESQCVSYGESAAYWPVLRVLEMVFDISPDDARAGISSKIVEGTRYACSDHWPDVAPYLAYLFDVRFEGELDDKVKYLDASGLKTQIVAAVRTFFERLTAAKPVLLVIDDWQWIDSESLEMIDALVSIPRLLLMGLARLEKEKVGYPAKEALKLRLGDRFEEMMLPPFDQRAGARLVENLLQQSGLPEQWTNRILGHAEGNPFYIEEILRSMIDTGILRRESGKWTASDEGGVLQGWRIPETVQAVVASRLDHLDPELRKILQMASVIGRTFSVSILERLDGLDSLMLSVQLATLEEYEYITEVKRRFDPEYAFRHATVQQVAYDSQTKGQRRKLHGRVGAALEDMSAGRVDEYAEALAFQYASSDNTEKAIEWLVKAGDKARARYANCEATGYFRRALEILDDQHETAGSNLTARERSYLALGDIAGEQGNHGDALRYYEAVLDGDFGRTTRARAARMIADIYYEEANIERSREMIERGMGLLNSECHEEIIEQAELLGSRAWIYQFQNLFEQAVGDTKVALGLLERLPACVQGAVRARAGLLGTLGGIYFASQQYDKSIATYRECLAAFEESDDKLRQAMFNSNLANVYFCKGDYEDARVAFERYKEVCAAIGYKIGISVALNSLACIEAVRERYDAAIKTFEQALKLCEELRSYEGIGVASGNLCSVCTATGDFERAVAMGERDLAVSTSIGNQRGVVRAHSFLCEAYLEAGEYKRARHEAETAVELLTGLGDEWKLATLWIFLAEIERLEHGDLNKASVLCERARNLAERTDAMGRMGLFHFVAGKVAAQGGDAFQAEQLLTRAMNCAEASGQRRLRASILRFRAGMACERGDAAGARRLLNSARAIYLELGLEHRVKECDRLSSEM